MLLHEVIDGSLDARADEPAIINGDDGEALSYRELSQRAWAYASKLRGLGLGPGLGCGDRVGIIARKSPDVVAAFLGASRAGVVYVPLDAQSTPAYWESVLDELSIRDVLTNLTGVAEKLSGFRVHELVPGEASGQSAPSGCRRACTDDAYILATSGSTGRPKGVLLSHRNALSFVDWASTVVGLGSDDRFLSVAPFHFDLSIFDIYGALSHGARTVLAPGMALMFPGQLIAAIDEHEISVLYTVPTVLRGLEEAGAFSGGGGRSLRLIIYAGEPYPPASLAKLMRSLPAVTFHNFFGPTETNVCLAHRFNGAPGPNEEIPIGLPASDACIRIVDENGTPIEPGGVGEIVAEGPSVMKGYVTREGFVAAEQPFATGDFARQDHDGVFYFCGRRDAQVKVRGARVELGSVENALLQIDGVSEAVAMVVKTDLVGFVASGREVDERSVRNDCRNSLPPGAVPHKIVVLERLPRLSNGKLDVLALKALAADL